MRNNVASPSVPPTQTSTQRFVVDYTEYAADTLALIWRDENQRPKHLRKKSDEDRVAWIEQVMLRKAGAQQLVSVPPSAPSPQPAPIALGVHLLHAGAASPGETFEAYVARRLQAWTNQIHSTAFASTAVPLVDPACLFVGVRWVMFVATMLVEYSTAARSYERWGVVAKAARLGKHYHRHDPSIAIMTETGDRELDVYRNLGAKKLNTYAILVSDGMPLLFEYEDCRTPERPTQHSVACTVTIKGVSAPKLV